MASKYYIPAVRQKVVNPIDLNTSEFNLTEEERKTYRRKTSKGLLKNDELIDLVIKEYAGYFNALAFKYSSNDFTKQDIHQEIYTIVYAFINGNLDLDPFNKISQARLFLNVKFAIVDRLDAAIKHRGVAFEGLMDDPTVPNGEDTLSQKVLANTDRYSPNTAFEDVEFKSSLEEIKYRLMNSGREFITGQDLVNVFTQISDQNSSLWLVHENSIKNRTSTFIIPKEVSATFSWTLHKSKLVMEIIKEVVANVLGDGNTTYNVERITYDSLVELFKSSKSTTMVDGVYEPKNIKGINDYRIIFKPNSLYNHLILLYSEPKPLDEFLRIERLSRTQSKIKNSKLFLGGILHGAYTKIGLVSEYNFSDNMLRIKILDATT
jgi:hypothetical protein